jgi:hypothetical protein
MVPGSTLTTLPSVIIAASVGMAAALPFPGIGFQITNEEVLTDDLPCYEQKTNDKRRLIWYPQKIKEKS